MSKRSSSVFTKGPPMLDPDSNKIEGLAFIGLCLTRNHSEDSHAWTVVDITEDTSAIRNDWEKTNSLSITRQKAYDFNAVQDRNYTFLQSTNDDGWLVGGGEPKSSYKLPSIDSAHIEIMRVGTFDPELGGLSVDSITAVLQSGRILIPHMAIIPTAVVANSDRPPEIEVQFNFSRDSYNSNFLEWPNWQLQFVHNQLFEYFKFPGRFCPDPFHMTIVRKATFRSEEHMIKYHEKCSQWISACQKTGPQLLEPETDATIPGNVTNPLSNELNKPHGLYLFRHRLLPIRYFAPNFHPPYDTTENRIIILNILSGSFDGGTTCKADDQLRL